MKFSSAGKFKVSAMDDGMPVWVKISAYVSGSEKDVELMMLMDDVRDLHFLLTNLLTDIPKDKWGS